MDTGFIGIGVMGQPMALNLIQAGVRLAIWNRSPEKCDALRAAGASVVQNISDVFQQTKTVILMLLDSTAIDCALKRNSPEFCEFVTGHTIINMGSVSPEYSKALAADIEAAGGTYIEAPVSGSRKPAEEGKLVAMVAGNENIIEGIRPLLAPMCHEIVFCGEVGNALLMKLSVNLFLITMVTGLTEAVHFAQQQGLDLERLQSVLNAGPMASNVSKMKLSKLIKQDFSIQASIPDVFASSRLITEAARKANLSTPLIDACRELYAETLHLGYESMDMVAVSKAFEIQTKKIHSTLLEQSKLLSK